VRVAYHTCRRTFEPQALDHTIDFTLLAEILKSKRYRQFTE
jgi:hypothetical protein